jgi:Arc/MetJ-type ribon-helix-helix transcriptional regulator
VPLAATLRVKVTEDLVDRVQAELSLRPRSDTASDVIRDALDLGLTQIRKRRSEVA